jgi:predicted bacteriocin transport accessory protein
MEVVMKKIVVIVIALFTLMVTGCNKSTDLIEINYDSLAKKIENKDSFVLYVGSSTCSHCANFKPILEKVVNENKLEVYYINMANLSESKYNAVMKKIDGQGTPTTVYIEKGKTKTSPRIEGERDYDTTVEFFEDLNLIKGE